MITTDGSTLLGADDKSGIAEIMTAMEILINNEATKNLIRDGKNAQLSAIMEMSSGIGMQLMDQNLAFLVQQGTITQEEALKACHQVTAFKRYLIQG